MTTARPPLSQAASMWLTSLTSRKVTTPGRSTPGAGGTNGTEPVARISLSYPTLRPSANVTFLAVRSIPEAAIPVIRSMQLSSYQA